MKAEKTLTNMSDKSYLYWNGALSIIVGVLILVMPSMTVLLLVTLMSIWLLLTGVIHIVEGISHVKEGGIGWLVSIVVGLFGLGVGAYLVQRPVLSTLAIITLLGLVFITQGLSHVFVAFAHPSASGGDRMLSLLFAGISLVSGVWLWRYPFHGTLAFVWLLGLYTIASGTILIATGAQRPEQHE